MIAPHKGYWIAHVDVTEPEGYKAYMTADMAAFGKYGGRFLVRGGQQEVVEGKARGRTVVLEFRAIGPRSIATARRSTKPRPRCAKAKRSSISSSSRAVTRNPSEWRRGADPASTEGTRGG